MEGRPPAPPFHEPLPTDFTYGLSSGWHRLLRLIDVLNAPGFDLIRGSSRPSEQVQYCPKTRMVHTRMPTASPPAFRICRGPRHGTSMHDGAYGSWAHTVIVLKVWVCVPCHALPTPSVHVSSSLHLLPLYSHIRMPRAPSTP